MHTTSPPYQVWCLKVLRKWRYNVLNFAHDLTWPHDQKDIRYGKCESLSLSQHPAKFDVHRSWGGGDTIFSYCHVSSRDYMIKTICNLLRHHCAKFDVCWSWVSRDISFLFCQITSRDHTINQKNIWLGKWEPLILTHHCQIW